MDKKQTGAVIFDLDGTLLDTIEDLQASANHAAKLYGIRSYSQEEIRSFVGHGIRCLMQQVIPGAEENPHFEEIFAAFKEHYAMHCNDSTRPYPGIIDLLKQLKIEGYALAIVSNKADFAVKKLCEHYFSGLIDVAIGEREGCSRKPAPDAIYIALAELGKDKKNAVYVGDSEVDLLTADNAGVPCIPVSWGFRGRDTLTASGAEPDSIADDANVLYEMIKELLKSK